MITPLGTLTIADGGTISVSMPDDGGVEIVMRPFSNRLVTPAVTTLNLAHTRELIGLLNVALGWQARAAHEGQTESMTT